MSDVEPLSDISALARIPEHSRGLMCAMSGGACFGEGGYLFFNAEDWLLAVAYPLEGAYSHEAFETALDAALQRTGAVRCWAVGPDFPERLRGHIGERDRYYVISAGSATPARLRGPLAKARGTLRVEEGNAFTAGHRRLWAEFLSRAGSTRMAPHVLELYARTPVALERDGNLRLLNAWDDAGNLAACLLLDHGPRNFTSYVLGAHSRTHYVPHATDLLFETMLANARAAGKRFVHLGLGVNDGIRRFKLKWGAKPASPYLYAAWEELPRGREEGLGDIGRVLLRAMAGPPKPSLDIPAPPQRPFAMLWQVARQGRVSWLGGTAHFFCCSFEDSFSRLFRNLDTVLFEGPLDQKALSAVEANGRTLAGGTPPLLDALDASEIRKLERVVRGPEGRLARVLGMEFPHRPDVRHLLRHTQPWFAFFSLWSGFLERLGWGQSVDMEAWRVAGDMNKRIVAMESVAEQLDSLNSVPSDRILRFLRNCGQWRRWAKRNRRAYLAGDLENLVGTSAEFPTRTEYVINTRDQRFRERMLPHLEAGGCAVLVGAAHLVNLRRMLVEDGFAVTPKPFGMINRIRARLRGGSGDAR